MAQYGVAKAFETRSKPAPRGIQPNPLSQVPEQGIDKRLVWSSRRPDDWEILVYRHGSLWEACFFRWAIHHEHAIASSFEAVCQRAEQRITALEEDRLRSTVWKRMIH